MRLQQKGCLFTRHGSWHLIYYKHGKRVQVAIARMSSTSPEQARALADKLLRPVNSHWHGYRRKTTLGNMLQQAHKQGPRLTLEQKEQMLKKQKHRCAICGTTNPGNLGWHYDHNHETGQSREALCGPCNVALGFVREDVSILQRMIAYIHKHTTVFAL